MGLRGSEELDELDTETDCNELYEALRGGSGGAAFDLGGEDSNCISGGGVVDTILTMVSEICLAADAPLLKTGLLATYFF